MIEKIGNLVEKACKKDTNVFGYGAWSHHITSVVKYSKLLARKLNADEEIVVIAALLHDYARIIDGECEDHHVSGAKEAEKILKAFNYPQEKIDRVKHCIFAHRGSVPVKRETVEAECVASADAMAHFDNVSSLLYFAYARRKLGIDEGAKWVAEKLERSWKKLRPEAKELIKEKYEAGKKLLGKSNK